MTSVAGSLPLACNARSNARQGVGVIVDEHIDSQAVNRGELFHVLNRFREVCDGAHRGRDESGEAAGEVDPARSQFSDREDLHGLTNYGFSQLLGQAWRTGRVLAGEQVAVDDDVDIPVVLRR